MAFLRRKKKPSPPLDPGLAQLLEQQQQIEEAIARYETLVTEEPARLRQETLDRINTMPPPEDIEERRREKRIVRAVTRGEVINERRYQASHGTLLLLLMAAAAALAWWVWKSAQPFL